MRALLAAALVVALPAAAQQAPVQPFGVIGAPAGTGRWPAVAEYRADLPGQTIYRPAKRPAKPLPLVLWGNGACRDNGLQHSAFLRELASHGYMVIALGKARNERDPAAPPSPPPPRGADETEWTQMREALDWASAGLKGWVDPAKVAVMGHSCGGLQTIAMSADPRVKTGVLFNSGVYIEDLARNRSNIRVEKSMLAKLHGPIAYFLGGPEDIAYANARDDVARIGHVPVFFGELPVGHSGTFWSEPNGGAWAKVAVGWLDWRLKGSAKAARMFRGKDCGLCRDMRWKLIRKGI